MSDKEYLEKYRVGIKEMNAERLLLEVLSNPDYLSYAEYESLSNIIRERAVELGIFSKGV